MLKIYQNLWLKSAPCVHQMENPIEKFWKTRSYVWIEFFVCNKKIYWIWCEKKGWKKKKKNNTNSVLEEQI